MNPIVTATAGTLLRSPLSSPIMGKRNSWTDISQLGKTTLTVPSTVSHSSCGDLRRGSHGKREMFAYSDRLKEDHLKMKKKKKLKSETTGQKKTNQLETNKQKGNKKKLKDVAQEVKHQKSKKKSKDKEKCNIM